MRRPRRALIGEDGRSPVARLMTALVWLALAFALVPLISLSWTVIAKGAPQINTTFLTYSMFRTSLDQPVGIYHALIGTLNHYPESSIQPKAHGAFSNVEWFVQDNWHLARHFSLDGGVRFYLIKPTRSQNDKVAMFVPPDWQASQASQLFQPVTTPQGRQALHPVTGQTLPPLYIGRLVPGPGDEIN